MKDNKELFADYFEKWIQTYKTGSIRGVTMKKYINSLKWIRDIAPKVRMKDLDRAEYQKLINEFAKTHEKQTVLDFHHHCKAAILDAFDDGIIKKDPTRRVRITGKIPTPKKDKFLSKEELKKLLDDLDINGTLNYDYLILLIAKTGLRFSEAVALTPDDFDFKKKLVRISKTWDYKNGGGFVQTKNESSIRTVLLDDKTVEQMKAVVKGKIKNQPLFVKQGSKIYNSTVNDILLRHCKKCGITEISLHALRHTHASILLYQGVSIGSVSARLGHSNMATTQKVYLHIIRELENKDKEIILDSLSNL